MSGGPEFATPKIARIESRRLAGPFLIASKIGGLLTTDTTAPGRRATMVCVEAIARFHAHRAPRRGPFNYYGEQGRETRMGILARYRDLG